jgi:hypothetical protein
MRDEANQMITYNLLLEQRDNGKTILATCAVHGEGMIPRGLQQSFRSHNALEAKLDAAGIAQHRYQRGITVVQSGENTFFPITELEACKLSLIVKQDNG